MVPGAYKADLWRYCILYIYGGIYIDIKLEPINGFRFRELLDKEYFVLDCPYMDKNCDTMDKILYDKNYQLNFDFNKIKVGLDKFGIRYKNKF